MLIGCGGEEEPEPDASLIVGTGEVAFEDTKSIDGVPLIAGPQGGYHIWVAVRCRGVGPQQVQIRYGVSDAQSAELLSVEGLRAVVDLLPVDGWDEWLAMTAFLTSGDTSTYAGREIVLWAEVEDATGQPLSDTAPTVVTNQIVDLGGA